MCHLCHLCRPCHHDTEGGGGRGGGHRKVCRDTCRDMGKLHYLISSSLMSDMPKSPESELLVQMQQLLTKWAESTNTTPKETKSNHGKKNRQLVVPSDRNTLAVTTQAHNNENGSLHC